jgi:hypothetical protein
MTDESPRSDAYIRHLSALIRLHLLAGESDGPAAGAVRDGMDESWHAMSDGERRRIGELSEDLYRVAEYDGPALNSAARLSFRPQDDQEDGGP